MSYVAAAYAIVFLLVGGYVVSVVMRRREVERSLAAWSERPQPVRPGGEMSDDGRRGGEDSDA